MCLRAPVGDAFGGPNWQILPVCLSQNAMNTVAAGTLVEGRIKGSGGGQSALAISWWQWVSRGMSGLRG